jgi:DHA1 family bicyclomycin/chloramphenicol resistance-like MFS transporter
MKKPNNTVFLPNAKNIRLQFEFVALMASLMSVVALAIDALCRLWILGVTIGTTEVVDNQLLITMIFLGLGFGPLVLAPFR